MILTSAVQHHKCRFGFLWLFLLASLLHFIGVLAHTTAMYGCAAQIRLLLVLLSWANGCKLLASVSPGRLDAAAFFVRPRLLYFFFSSWELHLILLAWDTSREAHYLRITAWKVSSLEALHQSFLDCVLLCTLLGTGTPCSSPALWATCWLL